MLVPESPPSDDDPVPLSDSAGLENDEVIRQFVEHWGMMARAWGINATMGELFALLYVSGHDWTADDLRERLRVSRGNVSMNLRELMAWGVIHKVHRPGERREYFRAEIDVWTLFRHILNERKRRELDPTLVVLDRAFEMIPDTPEQAARRKRVLELKQFFELISSMATRLLALTPDELKDLQDLFLPDGDPSEPAV